MSGPEPTRSLCVGGSFNPPHVGHLVCARFAAEAAGLDRVRMIVSARPPHKPGDADVIDASTRLDLCRAAVAGDDLFRVDDREIRRDGPSYTADTARELIDSGEEPRPVSWLIGADLLSSLTTWHESDLLLSGDLVRFVVMRRGGYEIDWPALPPAVRGLEAAVVDVPGIEVSATLVRRRVREGRGVRDLVPPAVAEMIEARGLYR